MSYKMNLSTILSEALVQLGQANDQQMKKHYDEKHKLYANDCLLDLAYYYHLRKTETITVSDGVFDLSTLESLCKRVSSVSRDDVSYSFYLGAATGYIKIPDMTDGSAEITYEYIPDKLEDDSAYPDVPEQLHNLFPLYIAGRDRAAGNREEQQRATTFFQLYENGKKTARASVGEADAYTIFNKF